MTLINKASFAKLVNISRASVTNNVSRGKIKTDEDGLIDPDDPVNIAFIQYINGRKQIGTDAKRTGRPKGIKSRPKIQRPKPVQRVDFSNDFTYPETADSLVQLEGWQNLAPSLKAAADFEKRRLENAKEWGKVIDRELVKQFVFKLFAIDTNEFLAASNKIANVVAGLCGVTEDGKISELGKAVQTELYKTLSHIKRLTDDFLKGLEK